MVLKAETIQSWFTGISASANNKAAQPFQNAQQMIEEYNLAIEHNSLTLDNWNQLLKQCDDSLGAYLTHIKGTAASMDGYTVFLQNSISGWKQVSAAIKQYNSLSKAGTSGQAAFANAVSATNTGLGTYLTGLKGAQASLGGYAASLLGTAAKTTALKAAAFALNTFLAGWVSFLISTVSSYIHHAEIIEEKAEAARRKIQSLNEEWKQNQKFVSDSAKRYAELAQGVDQLTGQNKNLTTDDYKDFLNLSSQLADMFPTLTRNYNENGDAMVQLSGDVDTITGSLQHLIEVQKKLKNQQIVDQLPAVFDDFTVKSWGYERELNTLENRKIAAEQTMARFTSGGFYDTLRNGLDKKSFSVVSHDSEEHTRLVENYRELLRETGLTFSHDDKITYTLDQDGKPLYTFTNAFNLSESSDEDIAKAKTMIDSKAKAFMDQYTEAIDNLEEKIEAFKNQKKANQNSLSSSIFSWLSVEDSFQIMDPSTQAVVQNMINSLDWNSLNFSSWEKAAQYIQDHVLSLFLTPEGEKLLDRIQYMLDLQTQLYHGKISVQDYQDYLQRFLSNLKAVPEKSQKPIQWMFDVQIEEDGSISSPIGSLINKVQSKLQDEFHDKAGQLTLKDLEIAAEQIQISEDGLLSWEQLITKIKELKNLGLDGGFHTPFTTPEMISKLNGMSQGFEIMHKIYESISKEGPFDWKLLDDNTFKEIFPGLKGYKDFMRV